MKLFSATILVVLFAIASSAEVGPTTAGIAAKEVSAAVGVPEEIGTVSRAWKPKPKKKKCVWKHKWCKHCYKKWVKVCKKKRHGHGKKCVWKKKKHCRKYRCWKHICKYYHW